MPGMQRLVVSFRDRLTRGPSAVCGALISVNDGIARRLGRLRYNKLSKVSAFATALRSSGAAERVEGDQLTVRKASRNRAPSIRVGRGNHEDALYPRAAGMDCDLQSCG